MSQTLCTVSILKELFDRYVELIGIDNADVGRISDFVIISNVDLSNEDITILKMTFKPNVEIWIRRYDAVHHYDLPI